MKYYVIVLPKATDGSVNRQVYEFDNYESAKQAFHFNCGKYFCSTTLSSASVMVIDELCNTHIKDYWVASTDVTE